MISRIAFACLLIFVPTLFAADEDPFLAGVRSSPPLTPGQEQQSFTLPPGFTIELVTAEPDILKPMNMAFDARGRLWITVTQEYPYAAPMDRPGGDAVKVLEDADHDGHFEKITTFADKLNIPIGIYPYGDGAIVYGIPFIWYLRDTDHDGVADERKELLGPMGYQRDTHGMNNSFRRGFDGWLYACHGFNNETRVAGTDGHEIFMQSGNTYRFRLDGSRVEQFTWGQVNPFGMTMDPLFNLFTADCHSKPIYQLLRGGYYPSFGKPDDGLGFVPPMMEHLHGSTAIAGALFYAAKQFPEEFRGNMFSGNVMTSRINRNSILYRGSTMLCREEDDFLKSSDPWFRPVDLCLGPDGSMYVADFYNRIIGHYEVPLEHPGRDRTSGRIWRIRYTGTNASQNNAPLKEMAPIDLTAASIDQLVQVLGEDNIARRGWAADQIADRVGSSAVPALKNAFDKPSSPEMRVHSLWCLFRLGAIDDSMIELAAHDTESMTRVHAMKVLSETAKWSQALAGLATPGLSDSDPFVRRAAADALAQHPEVDAIPKLLDAIQAQIDLNNGDVMLLHGLRIALRNQLTAEGRYEEIQPYLDQPAAEHLAGISLAVTTSDASLFLLKYLQGHEVPMEQASAMLQHAARYASAEATDGVVAFARSRFPNNIDFQLTLLASLHQAIVQRGEQTTPTLREWGLELSRSILSTPQQQATWSNRAVSQSPRSDNPWVVQTRPSSDGKNRKFLCSLPRGEQLTGILRSPTFVIPERLSFFIAGHSGFPDKPLTPNNYVRLCLAKSDEEIARSPAPRNDNAQRVEWDLHESAGEQGYFEIVDSDDAGAYAWLAVGRFQPAVVSVPDESPNIASQRQQSAAVIVEQLKLEELSEPLKQLLRAPGTEGATSSSAARALLAIQPDSRFDVLPLAIGLPDLGPQARRAAIDTLLNRDAQQLGEVVAQVTQSVPGPTQSAIAAVLASSDFGGHLLLDLVARGRASPRLLLERAIQQRLKALALSDVDQKIEELTQGLPSAGETVAAIMTQRREAFTSASHSLENGEKVFEKSCAICHQLAGKGAMVGPQLDGIGNRGLERLLEDLLDPNRNVDVAFRTTALSMLDGRIITGLLKGEQGETLVLIDDKGKELMIPKGDVDVQTKSSLSLMPENITTTMEEKDFLDVIAFLLTKRAEK